MIAIVDYGLGNIKAFANLYKRLNIEYRLASLPEHLEDASKIILPGVGAFDYAMELLNRSGMRALLNEKVLQQKVPVMGICVGMQILANSSEEGTSEGLGWIPGEVKKFSRDESESEKFPLPHMGWNTVAVEHTDGLFLEMGDRPEFYFLHSYYFSCRDESHALAYSDYGGRFSSIVKAGNIYGVQCHPEKSHRHGLMLLRNFARLESC